MIKTITNLHNDIDLSINVDDCFEFQFSRYYSHDSDDYGEIDFSFKMSLQEVERFIQELQVLFKIKEIKS